MQTLRDLVADVIANPAAYTDAFPVAERQEPDAQESVSDYIRERFVEMLAAPSPFLRDMNGPSADLSGALVTPEVIDRARERLRQETRRWAEGPDFRVDPTADPNRLYFVNTPRHFGRRLAQRNWAHGPLSGQPLQNGEPVHQAHCYFCNTDGLCVTRPHNTARPGHEQDGTPFNVDICVGCLGRQAAMQPFGCEARPDHYRVRGGQCACGFRSIYREDMDEHIDDTLIEGSDGVPKRWRVCERCGASRLCRRVPVATGRPISFNPETLSPVGPVIGEQHWCDGCARG